MTREEVIAIAKSTCETQGWRWYEPAHAKRSKTDDGRDCWWVSSEDPDDYLNRSIAPDYTFQIDDATGEVLSMGSNFR